MTEPTPWGAMLAVACSIGIAPANFWRLSLNEWRAIAGAPSAGILRRADFDALAERFPD